MSGPDARKPLNQQASALKDIETLNEATRRYVGRLVEYAGWIGRELDLCQSPNYRVPNPFLAENYCHSLRNQLRPTLTKLVPWPKDFLVDLTGFGVPPTSLLSMLDRSGLGEDFPRATNWLWNLLDQLPADVWTSGKPPPASLVDEWKKATEMLRGCLASILADAPPVGQGRAPAEAGQGQAQDADRTAYDLDAFMPVKELREEKEPFWSCADWTKIKAGNPWLRFDPTAPTNRPRIHRADADKLRKGNLDPNTFELLDVQGEDLPSVADGEITDEYLAGAAARKAAIQAAKRRRRQSAPK